MAIKSPAHSPFYFYFSLLVAVVVGVGFLPTLDRKLIHPVMPRPLILYFHVALFTTWVLLFITQATLVWIRRREWHRRVGVLGVCLGALIPVLGLATAFTITRGDMSSGVPDAAQGFIIPLFDMTAFALLFSLAIYWRRRPDYHARFMLIASAGLTVAAFARFPDWLVPDNMFYVAVDVLIAVAIARDCVTMRRVHPVFRYGVPALIAAQAMTMWLLLSGNSVWGAIARALLT